MNIIIKNRKAYNSGPSKVLSIPKVVLNCLEKKYGKDIIFEFEFDEKKNALIWKVKT